LHGIEVISQLTLVFEEFSPLFGLGVAQTSVSSSMTILLFWKLTSSDLLLLTFNSSSLLDILGDVGRTVVEDVVLDPI